MTDRRAPARSLLAGRYRLGHLVGRGGMADVYAAEDESTGARVAVKVFRDPLVPGAEGEVRHGEVRALEGLRHPGLVELLDVGEDDGWPFVVMTLVDGPTLAERLSQGALSREAVGRIGSDLAAALAYVHDRGVVHRDIKPANVLIAGDGRARLADFGIARLVDATRVTRSGFTIGTAGYLAPEQVTGERITPAADVYALGLVLLECLTGRREYDGPVIEAALARLHRRPQIPDDLPAGWRSFLQALTADEPVERPSAAITASAAGVLAEQPGAPSAALRLERLGREPGPRVVAAEGPLAAPAAAAAVTSRQSATRQERPAPAERAVPSARRSRRGLLLGTAAVVVLVASGAAVLLDRQQDQTAVTGSTGTASAQTSSGALSGSAASQLPPAAAESSASPGPAMSPKQALAAVTTELQDLLAADPAAAGTAATALLERLREVGGLKGAAKSNAAVALSDDVRQSMDDGRLDAALGARIETALDRVAAPPDLVGLVRLARHDPEAVGVIGPDLGRRLTTLDHDTATEDVPQTAQRLMDTVQQGTVTGRVNPAFARIAVPVLEPLARTEPLDALRDLVDELDEQFQAGGEVDPEFLERLGKLLVQTVYQRTLQSRALIRDLDDAADRGEVTLALQTRAVPILEQVAQRGSGTPR